MNWIRRTYLYQLYHYQKKLFWIVFFFAAGTLFCTFRGNQSTPFWVWGMYSAPVPSHDTGSILLMFNQSGSVIPIYTNKGFKSRFYLHSPLIYFHSAQEIGKDPRKAFFETKLPSFYSTWIYPMEEKLFTTNFTPYGSWLKNYLGQMSQTAIDSVYITQYHYIFSSDKINITSIDTLYVF
jgi:hypothetical protein